MRPGLERRTAAGTEAVRCGKSTSAWGAERRAGLGARAVCRTLGMGDGGCGRGDGGCGMREGMRRARLSQGIECHPRVLLLQRAIVRVRELAGRPIEFDLLERPQRDGLATLVLFAFF